MVVTNCAAIDTVAEAIALRGKPLLGSQSAVSCPIAIRTHYGWDA